MAPRMEERLFEKVRELERDVKSLWEIAVGEFDDPEGFIAGSGLILINQQDEVSLVTFSELPRHVGISSAFDHPLVVKYKTLIAVMGEDAAWAEMTNDEKDGLRFSDAWQRCVEDMHRGAKMTYLDLVKIESEVKEGLRSSPRFAVVLWNRPGKSVLWSKVTYETASE